MKIHTHAVASPFFGGAKQSSAMDRPPSLTHDSGSTLECVSENVPHLVPNAQLAIRAAGDEQVGKPAIQLDDPPDTPIMEVGNPLVCRGTSCLPFGATIDFEATSKSTPPSTETPGRKGGGPHERLRSQKRKREQRGNSGAIVTLLYR